MTLGLLLYRFFFLKESTVWAENRARQVCAWRPAPLAAMAMHAVDACDASQSYSEALSRAPDV
jgi:hypothetical protein